MVKKRTTKRVSKAEWLEKALEVFRLEGEPGIRIEAIARKLGINKAGFYWHFRDRGDLLEQLLAYWEAEYTKVVTENTILKGLPAAERLLATMSMIYEHRLAELDVHFNAWALKNPDVEKVVQRVIRLRLHYLRDTFTDAGFEREEAEMRARLFVGYESNEGLMFRFKNEEQARSYRELRWRLYVSELKAD